MRKRLAFASIAVLILVALKAASTAAEEKAPEVALQGTVVDLHCYVTHGIRDAAHTACANACIARGVPAGFLAEDGTLYILFEEKPFSVKDRVANLADVPVVLRGAVSVRNGMKGIQVTSIEKKKA
ncbi:MAG: hypothetical protein LC796_04635 [Acidobacteria bacterium]|nr:hypothetical protein [Acidobacteriota bacterium]MCA1609683.1 hypothetical protein [Acidobacteriota bacterium]